MPLQFSLLLLLFDLVFDQHLLVEIEIDVSLIDLGLNTQNLCRLGLELFLKLLQMLFAPIYGILVEVLHLLGFH